MNEKRYAKEITEKTWFGVEIPEWLRAFDCRANDDEIAPKSPWGTCLWSSERAAVDLGLRTKEECFDTRPLSCSTYTDARTASENELRRQVADMVKEATRLRDEYEHAKQHRAGKDEGGSCLYQPVAICLSNFGWSVLSDTRTQVVRRFGYNETA